jgi:hypothetical protein
MKLHDIFGTPDISDDFIAGVEYEIESVKDCKLLAGPYGFMQEHDHSLRNNGIEYKTAPLSLKNSLDAFSFLHDRLSLGENPFSERTSIHVHVNVGNLTEHQAKQFVLLYALFEPLFFKFVGQQRQDSIFCVPLTYTYLPTHYSNNFQSLVGKWHKYTAFNILPVKNLGTFEFRHLGGTGDKKRFTKWITSLADFYNFVKASSNFNLLEYLSKDNEIAPLAHEMIPQLSMEFSKAQIDAMCYDNILDVKLANGGF